MNTVFSPSIITRAAQLEEIGQCLDSLHEKALEGCARSDELAKKLSETYDRLYDDLKKHLPFSIFFNPTPEFTKRLERELKLRLGIFRHKRAQRHSV